MLSLLAPHRSAIESQSIAGLYARDFAAAVASEQAKDFYEMSAAGESLGSRHPDVLTKDKRALIAFLKHCERPSRRSGA